MLNANTSKGSPNEQTELLRTLVIVQLGLAGVPQQKIRAIARCDMNRVSSILKHLVPKKKKLTS
jgi:hypothetical protein